MTRLPSLRNAREFRRVLTEGSRGRSDGVVAFRAAASGPGRVGLVVPGRVGGAVVRNKLKRRLRAILSAMGEPRSSDLVVRVEPAAARMSFQDLEKHVKHASDRSRG